MCLLIAQLLPGFSLDFPHTTLLSLTPFQISGIISPLCSGVLGIMVNVLSVLWSKILGMWSFMKRGLVHFPGHRFPNLSF